MDFKARAPFHTHSLTFRYEVGFRREDGTLEKFNWTDRRKEAFRQLYAKAVMWIILLHGEGNTYFSKYIHYGKIASSVDKSAIQSQLTFNEDDSVTISLDYKLYQKDFTPMEILQISEDLRCTLLSLTTEGCEPHLKPKQHVVDDYTELFWFEDGIVWFHKASNLDTAFAKVTIPFS